MTADYTQPPREYLGHPRNPYENQQTVEAALLHRCPHMPGEPCDCPDPETARAALRDLVAQAEALRAEVDRQLGRHLCYTSDYSRERFWRDVDDALARLDGAR